MRVLAFRVYHHYQILAQLVEGDSGKDYAGYVAVLGPDVVHADYEPTESGGQGLVVPSPYKLPYDEVRHLFPTIVARLEDAGYRYRT